MTDTHPLFQITTIPNSGLGAVATAPITRGTLLISEPALFLLTADFLTTAAANAGIAAKLRTLTPPQLHSFLTLTNAHTTDTRHPFAGIMRTNALPCGVDAVECGVFPTCSRFNHSCNPNANYCWNEKTRQEVVYAVKDIAVGEQICVSYLDEESTNYPRAQRQQRLRKDFSFECRCAVCSGDAAAVAASDERRREVGRLDALVGGGTLMMGSPQKALGCCRRILALLGEEGIKDVSLYRTYYDAFQICVAHGDMARAAALARLGVAVKVACHGSVAVEEKLWTYAKSPEKHRLASMSRRWATKVGDAKEIGSEGFEEWLWARAR
ncbi:uncharacterized protein H6S33_011436 [Morchella sextelata]|uniref:uncharacterized protein n=1 Tax=Morchella sextelata TaxID=1174677 RepID=UPI001D042269|nr:uncharacterized protein H6S33_011436 [Morchella sextelata]KAH0611009.1 hypothetical protein H6S33_011436 [Morchella sextelata]